MKKPTRLLTNRGLDKHMNGRNDVATHLDQKDRQGEDGCKGDPFGKRLSLFLLARNPVVTGLGRCHGCWIPCRAACIYQIGCRDKTFDVNHRRRLGGEVDVHLDHSRHRGKRLVDPPDARGTGHGCNREFGLGRPRGVAQLAKGFDDFRNALERVHAHTRGFGCKIHRHILYAVDCIQCAVDPANAGRT